MNIKVRLRRSLLNPATQRLQLEAIEAKLGRAMNESELFADHAHNLLLVSFDRDSRELLLSSITGDTRKAAAVRARLTAGFEAMLAVVDGLGT